MVSATGTSTTVTEDVEPASTPEMVVMVTSLTLLLRLFLPADSIREKKERKNYLPRTITVSNKKDKETILTLARSRLPEKRKVINAGRQHC